jgi:hypothetical protein
MAAMKRRAFILSLAATTMARPSMAETLAAGNATIKVQFAGLPAATSDLILAWIKKSADAVMLYYGKFPVPKVDVVVEVNTGTRVGGGRTFPGPVPTIEIRVGQGASEEALMLNDWVMVHEMVHLAFPWMNLRHNWMAEGLAVYIESIARVRAGHLTEQKVWMDFVKSMPKGLPQPGDRGLDITVTWGRTYWGGALFCLLADIAIRQETGNRASLQTALRAINSERDFRSEHPLRETLVIGDAATGVNVLTAQYDAMREVPVATDLPALWSDLGIAVEGERLLFDETGRLATIRKAITAA